MPIAFNEISYLDRNAQTNICRTETWLLIREREVTKYEFMPYSLDANDKNLSKNISGDNDKPSVLSKPG